MAIKLARWFIFSVVVALVPLVFSYLSLERRGGAITVSGVIGNGELMILIAAMCAGALGELFGSGDQARMLKVMAGGAATVLLMLASLYYADVVATRFFAETADADAVARTSLALFGIALVASGSCIALSEL